MVRGTLTGTFSIPYRWTQPPNFWSLHHWFGDGNNNRNGVEHSTMNVHHGSAAWLILRFQNVRATMNANGVITVSLDKARCG